jgi:hypothetical protein
MRRGVERKAIERRAEGLVEPERGRHEREKATPPLWPSGR